MQYSNEYQNRKTHVQLHEKEKWFFLYDAFHISKLFTLMTSKTITFTDLRDKSSFAYNIVKKD